MASGLAVAVSVALLAGTTFAWFTDSVTNKGNKIQSGTLDVSLSEFNNETKAYDEITEKSDPIFNYTNWEPGYSDVASFKISNNGSLALKYQFDIVTKGEDADAAYKLADVIDVYYKAETGAITELPENTDGMTPMGTLSQILASQEDGVAFGHLEEKEADYATIVLKMRESAGNDYQDLSIGTEFDIILKATQYTSETDGFGSNQYDAAATYPVVTKDEFKDAIANAKDGDIISLASDLVIDEPVVIDDNITINGNGATITVPNNSDYAIDITSGTSATVTGCTFNKGTAIHLQPGVGDVVIDGCNFNFGITKSVWINGGNNGSVVIQNCNISRSLNVEGYNNLVKDVTIKNNVFSGIYDGTLVLSGNLENVEICNNDFKLNSDIRVYYEEGTSTPNFNNVTIHDNTYTKANLVQFDAGASEDCIDMDNNTKV